MKKFKLTFLILLTFVLIYFTAAYVIVSLFEKRITTTTHNTMKEFNKFAENKKDEINYFKVDGKNFKYHYFNNNSMKTVILTHGITSNKDNVTLVAKKLYDNKYNVILYDMRTDFENKKIGTIPTFGYYESDDLHKLIIDFKSRHKDQNISLYGVSMGAATTVMYAQKYDKENLVKSYIAESSYSNMLDQFNQESKSTLPIGIKWAKPAIDLILKIKHNYTTDNSDLRKNMKNIKHPLLLISPDHDPRINPNNTKELYRLSNKDYVNYKFFKCNEHANSYTKPFNKEFFKILLDFYNEN